MSKRFETLYRLVDSKGFRYLPNVIYPEIPLSDEDIYVITTEGDRLDLLSQQFYGTHKYWWVIAMANGELRTDTLVLEPGLQIRIPENPNECLNQFLELNKL